MMTRRQATWSSAGRALLTIGWIVLLAVSGGCGGASTANVKSESDGAKPPPADGGVAENDPGFHQGLLKIADEYLSYGLVDEEVRFAPALCAAPRQDDEPVLLRSSASGDTGTHGRKLYFLFASHSGEYELASDSPSPVGQALIKESWEAKPVAEQGEQLVMRHPCGRDVHRHRMQGEQLYEATRAKELFIMHRLDPDTPNTDDGWVYGTVALSNPPQVTSAGRVGSCMGCHQQQEHRLFGLSAK